jgi:hypothetical protein
MTSDTSNPSKRNWGMRRGAADATPEPAPVLTSPPPASSREAERIDELERQLAEARQELQTRPRLQDLTPDELAGSAVGAAGEIVKAARAQAFELRNAANKELEAARVAADELLSKAEADTKARQARTVEEADRVLAAAHDDAGRIRAQAQSEADTITTAARSSAQQLAESGRAQFDELMEDVKSKSKSASTRASAIVDAANKSAADSLEKARSEARFIEAESRAAVSAVIASGLAALASQGAAFNELASESGRLRTSIADLAETVRRATEAAALTLSDSENRSLASASFVDQQAKELRSIEERLTQKSLDGPL